MKEVQNVPLLSKEQDIVYLDDDDDDNQMLRNHLEFIKKVNIILNSDEQECVLDPMMKKKLEGYIKTMNKAVQQERLYDALNITSEGVSKDIYLKTEVDLKHAELSHLLQSITPDDSSVINPITDQFYDVDDDEEEINESSVKHKRQLAI